MITYHLRRLSTDLFRRVGDGDQSSKIDQNVETMAHDMDMRRSMISKMN